MKKNSIKQTEKRCENCIKSDEKGASIQKSIQKHKSENDALVTKLKQLAEESKKIIDNMVVLKQNKPLQQGSNEEVNKKELENAKKQNEFYEKRIKQMEKAQETQSFDVYTNTLAEIKKIDEDIDKSKTKNAELRKSQRDQEKLLTSAKPVISRNEMRKEVEILMGRLNAEKKQLEKKKENQDKILKKIEEIEGKYKDVCSKNNTTPISRPDFTVQAEELDFSTPSLRKSMPRSKSDANVLKSPQHILRESQVQRDTKTPRVSESMILQVKQNVGRISKSIVSFEKTHVQKMTDLEEKEKKLTQQKSEVEKDLEAVQQECLKAHQILKELQKLPRDVVLEQSQIRTLITETGQIDESPSVNVNRTAMPSNSKNKFKREVQGVKMMTSQICQWADYDTLPQERTYKINNLKVYLKDHYILRVEIEYKLQNGQTQQSIQPINSDDVVKERDVKCIDIQFSRTEYIQEITGLNDSSHITFLKIRTSYFKEYLIGQSKLNYKQKEFKYQILPSDKPISFFGSFDSVKGMNRKVLAQFGIEMMKKDVFAENRKSITAIKGSNSSQTQERSFQKYNQEQELVV